MSNPSHAGEQITVSLRSSLTLCKSLAYAASSHCSLCYLAQPGNWHNTIANVAVHHLNIRDACWHDGMPWWLCWRLDTLPGSHGLPGNAYAARKNSPDKSWQQAAYTDEIAHLVDTAAAGTNGNGNGSSGGSKYADRKQLQVTARMTAGGAAAAGRTARHQRVLPRRVHGLTGASARLAAFRRVGGMQRCAGISRMAL
jgi:hypothetical protein